MQSNTITQAQERYGAISGTELPEYASIAAPIEAATISPELEKENDNFKTLKEGYLALVEEVAKVESEHENLQAELSGLTTLRDKFAQMLETRFGWKRETYDINIDLEKYYQGSAKVIDGIIAKELSITNKEGMTEKDRIESILDRPHLKKIVSPIFKAQLPSATERAEMYLNGKLGSNLIESLDNPFTLPQGAELKKSLVKSLIDKGKFDFADVAFLINTETRMDKNLDILIPFKEIRAPNLEESDRKDLFKIGLVFVYASLLKTFKRSDIESDFSDDDKKALGILLDQIKVI